MFLLSLQVIQFLSLFFIRQKSLVEGWHPVAFEVLLILFDLFDHVFHLEIGVAFETLSDFLAQLDDSGVLSGGSFGVKFGQLRVSVR